MDGPASWLISNTSRKPGASRRLARGKYKGVRGPKAITFISLLLLLGALLPAAAQASVFGDFLAFLSGTAEAKSSEENGAPDTSANLQTLSLPRPAMNIDPAPAHGGGDITIVNESALLPEEGPAGTIADIEKPKNSTISIHTVRAGDTVQSIAKLFMVTEGTVLSANDLPRGATLKEGQQLIILPVSEVKYTVKRGDTLESIAKLTGGDVNEIAVRNAVDNSTLLAGQAIFIPNGEVLAVPESSPKKKAVAKVNVTTTEGGGKGYYRSPLAHYVQTQSIHGYNAVDMGAPSGTSIRATAAGDVVVARSGGWNGGYGSYVVITHGNGSQTLYAHMSKVAAVSGDQVTQGETIGYVGKTGLATGPHLHFEIRNGVRNPF